MASDRAWEDEYTLLCERCGYVVEGLPKNGACPECAKPIAESLPERRNLAVATGRFWFVYVNCWKAIRHPLRTLDRTPIDRRVVRVGLWTRIHAAALLGVSLCVGLGIATLSNRHESDGTLELAYFFMTIISVALFLATIAFLVIQLLTWIEVRGLMFLGDRRGARITPRVARCACAYGSVGWLIAALGFVPSFVGIPILFVVWGGWNDHGEYSSPTFPGWAWDVVELAPLVTLGIVLLGFLIFETFAWLGLRRLKYANTARPTGCSARSND